MKEAKKVFFIYLGEQWAFILLAVFAFLLIIYKNYIDDMSRHVDKMVGLLIVVVFYLFIQLIIKFQKEEKQKNDIEEHQLVVLSWWSYNELFAWMVSNR